MLTEDLPEAPIDWLIPGIWNGFGMICAEPKMGKTTMALKIAVAVAQGSKYEGIQVEQGKVVYLVGEDKPEDLRRRIGPSIPGLKFGFHRPKLDNQIDRMHLRSLLADEKPRLLVIDPLIRFHNSSENSSKAMAPILAFVRSLNIPQIIITHHSTKGKSSLRGSSELHAWGETNIYITKSGVQIEHRNAPPGGGDLQMMMNPDSWMGFTLPMVNGDGQEARMLPDHGPVLYDGLEILAKFERFEDILKAGWKID